MVTESTKSRRLSLADWASLGRLLIVPLVVVGVIASFLIRDKWQVPRRSEACHAVAADLATLGEAGSWNTFDVCRDGQGQIVTVFERAASDPGTEGNLRRCSQLGGRLYVAGHVWQKYGADFMCVTDGKVAFFANP